MADPTEQAAPRGTDIMPSDYTYAHSTAYRSLFSDQLAHSHTSSSPTARLARQKSAAQVADTYYDFVSPLYESGWGQTFHYCPLTPGLSIDDSMKVYDEGFAKKLGLKKGMRVLDVGCGIGGPARMIARSVGCEIVGVTINLWHKERGEVLTKGAGLEHLVTHVKADFLELPFGEGEFDAVYAFDALCYAADVREVYAEVWRVLKKGGIFGFHDWVMTEEFDEGVKKHLRIRNEIEFGNGITAMPSIGDVRSGLKEIGFETLHEENMALHSKPRPWYYGPAGYFWYSVGWDDFWKVFKMSTLVIMLNRLMFRVLILFGAMEPQILEMSDTMWACCRSVAAGGATGIFSPMWVFVNRKPEEGKTGKGKKRD